MISLKVTKCNDNTYIKISVYLNNIEALTKIYKISNI